MTGITPTTETDPNWTDENGKKCEKITETYVVGDKTYTKITLNYNKTGGAVLDEDETKEPAITITTTTAEETKTTTVTPGTVKVEMSEVTRVTEEGSTPITQEELDIKDATVTITKGDGENYTANVKLGLSGTLLSDGSVTVTVAGANGEKYETTLEKVEDNGNYTPDRH